VNGWQAMRAANAALAVWALIWLLIDLRAVRSRLDQRAVYLALGHSTPRPLERALGLAACTWTLLGLWGSRHDRRDGTP
jgi:hypothetical protein